MCLENKKSRLLDKVLIKQTKKIFHFFRRKPRKINMGYLLLDNRTTTKNCAPEFPIFGAITEVQ